MDIKQRDLIGNTLHLNLKRKWFDMIVSGEKLEEYREIKPYWINRLLEFFSETDEMEVYELKNDLLYPEKRQYTCYSEVFCGFDCRFKKFNSVTFKNGYQKNAQTIVVELIGVTIGKAKPEWSDNWQGNVFIIKLGNVISTSH